MTERDRLIADAIHKMDRDLEWRGPNNRAMGHVVLTRDLARAVLDRLRECEDEPDGDDYADRAGR
jgi:hypothetical protein